MSSGEKHSLYMMNRFHLGFYSHINIDQHTYIEHIKYDEQKLKRFCFTQLL